jgi:hypothetical protein
LRVIAHGVGTPQFPDTISQPADLLQELALAT